VSGSDYPTTDTEEIKQLLRQVLEAQNALNLRLDGQAVGINNMGENLTWLIQNVQGIFQMFASPQFVSQMTNMMMGGLPNVGQSGPEDPGPAEGTNSGGTGS
jgi:hypothetical protein